MQNIPTGIIFACDIGTTTMSKAERTRQLIIKKTAHLFNTKGFAGTSLSDLTKVTGLTKGSIYGNFTDKNEVALAAFDYNLQKINTCINTEINNADSYQKKLLAYVNVYKNSLASTLPEGGCPVLNTAIEADDTHQQLKKKAAEALWNWKNMIASIIRKGIKAGEFKKNVNPESTAITILASIEGGIMMAKLLHKRDYLNNVLESIINLIETLK